MEFSVGDRIWYTASSCCASLEHDEGLRVESDTITGITLQKDGRKLYYTGSFTYQSSEFHPELLDGYYFDENELYATKNEAIDAVINKFQSLKEREECDSSNDL